MFEEKDVSEEYRSQFVTEKRNYMSSMTASRVAICKTAILELTRLRTCYHRGGVTRCWLNCILKAEVKQVGIKKLSLEQLKLALDTSMIRCFR